MPICRMIMKTEVHGVEHEALSGPWCWPGLSVGDVELAVLGVWMFHQNYARGSRHLRPCPIAWEEVLIIRRIRCLDLAEFRIAHSLDSCICLVWHGQDRLH